MTSLLSADEISFLSRHGYSEEDVYDGRHQSKDRRAAAAKEAGKHLVLAGVIGRGDCRTLGHRLRTRAGHCIQCKPINIAFQRREDEPGYVYIAGSLSGRVIKVGTTGNLNQRENQMRAEGYGGSKDWIVLFSLYVAKGGEFERAASSRVKGNRVYRTYFKDGIEQGAVELHQCSFSEALRAMTEHLSEEERKRMTVFRSSNVDRYEFRHE
ncbi:GIY-YIG nuclease family protein [Bradyrhizobium liaoningense]|uniref:GIY-YIG nuclease family protein n=1 Tax=Bradyrhizobium liaoningense TaxID=43992 RepID=UPI001BA7FC4B|nr:GIY-YIG nuclease family protein [Bradyrhizobium liaoningense]MBR1169154.1 hypothetical protein [Bradyrhizobium liaoningense]